MRGYGSVAAFEDCDPCFLMYRKFGWLHNRLLLHLQDELQLLEEELKEFDKDDAINSRPVYQQSRRKDDRRSDSKRPIMLKLIKEKLEEYGRSPRKILNWAFLTPIRRAFVSFAKAACHQEAHYEESGKRISKGL